ncbi:MAG: hypothetical protein WBP33_11980 [Saprospiraceae bacterium]|nr:hypothetical protein [Saprospiraceae bacterium]
MIISKESSPESLSMSLLPVAAMSRKTIFSITTFFAALSKVPPSSRFIPFPLCPLTVKFDKCTYCKSVKCMDSDPPLNTTRAASVPRMKIHLDGVPFKFSIKKGPE